jgi:hypothetical protein
MPPHSDVHSHYRNYLHFYYIRIVAIIVVIPLVAFYLPNSIFNINVGKGIAYAHIFADTENAVTKNIDGKYQVSFLPYPIGLLVNDTSTKLNFSFMENNTDVPLLFTSLAITDKNTGGIVEQTPYKFHEFGDVTYPYTFRDDGEYKIAIQAKINGDPKYESQPLTASFDVKARYAKDDKFFSADNVILCYACIGWDSWNYYLFRE